MLPADPLDLGPLFLINKPPFVPLPHPEHHGNHGASRVGTMGCGVGRQMILTWVMMRPDQFGVHVEELHRLG